MKHTSSARIESLESRTFLSATAAAIAPIDGPPDLSVSLIKRLPPAALPATQVKTVARITNSGGLMDWSDVPISVWVSDSPTLDAGATLVGQTTLHARLKTGRSRNVPLPLTLPSALPSSGYHLIVQVNTEGAVIETSLDNNAVASSFLANPLGHYSGSVTIPHYGSVPFEFDLDGNIGRKIDSSLLGGGSSVFSSLDLHNVTATLSAAGNYNVRGSGTIHDTEWGDIRFAIGVHGRIAGQSMTGAMSITLWMEGSGTASVRCAFVVTKTG